MQDINTDSKFVNIKVSRDGVPCKIKTKENLPKDLENQIHLKIEQSQRQMISDVKNGVFLSEELIQV